MKKNSMSAAGGWGSQEKLIKKNLLTTAGTLRGESHRSYLVALNATMDKDAESRFFKIEKSWWVENALKGDSTPDSKRGRRLQWEVC